MPKFRIIYSDPNNTEGIPLEEEDVFNDIDDAHGRAYDLADKAPFEIWELQQHPKYTETNRWVKRKELSPTQQRKKGKHYE